MQGMKRLPTADESLDVGSHDVPESHDVPKSRGYLVGVLVCVGWILFALMPHLPDGAPAEKQLVMHSLAAPPARSLALASPALHSPSLLPPPSPSPSGFCLKPHDDHRAFATFAADGRRSMLTLVGDPDIMLEHAQLMPHKSELKPTPAPDEDAAALQRALEALAQRKQVPASKAVVLVSVYEYGIGSTINGLVLAVLDALGRGYTLFSPMLSLWAPLSNACRSQSLGCFFSSLPTIERDTAWGRVLLDALHAPNARLVFALSPAASLSKASS